MKAKQSIVTTLTVLAGLVVVAAAAPLWAQDEGPKTVTSPYQDEYDLKVGEVLTLNLRIDGVLWRNVTIDGGDSVDHRAGESVKTVITSEVENLGEDTLRLELVLLLEDAQGRQLHRLTLRPIKVGAGKFEQNDQKFKVDGGVLAQMAKIYLLAEVR